MKRVRKAVLPVAGLGTRMLPAAKTTPKEMLTVVDRPLIHWVVDEARDAGIEHIVLVTGRGKSALEDYFDHAPELHETLRAKGKDKVLADLIAHLPGEGEMSYVRQMAPLGLGHAVWCARDVIGDEPFAVLLPDMIMDAAPGATRQMLDALRGDRRLQHHRGGALPARHGAPVRGWWRWRTAARTARV